MLPALAILWFATLVALGIQTLRAAYWQAESERRANCERQAANLSREVARLNVVMDGLRAQMRKQP
jgi:hypothetical protein